jgi:hypothetical protein
VVQQTTVRTVVTERSSTRRTLGFAIGALGVTALATAAVTGIMALDAAGTAEERCTIPLANGQRRCIDDDGADAVDRGRVLLPVNLVAWLVAGAALATGTVLVLTSPKEPRVKASRAGHRIVF